MADPLDLRYLAEQDSERVGFVLKQVFGPRRIGHLVVFFDPDDVGGSVAFASSATCDEVINLLGDLRAKLRGQVA